MATVARNLSPALSISADASCSGIGPKGTRFEVDRVGQAGRCPGYWGHQSLSVQFLAKVQCTCEVDRLEERYPTGIGAGLSRRDELEAPSELTITSSVPDTHVRSRTRPLPPANRSIGGDTPLLRPNTGENIRRRHSMALGHRGFRLTDGSGRDRPASLLARAGGIHGVNSGMADRVQGSGIVDFSEKLHIDGSGMGGAPVVANQRRTDGTGRPVPDTRRMGSGISPAG